MDLAWQEVHFQVNFLLLSIVASVSSIIPRVLLQQCYIASLTFRSHLMSIYSSNSLLHFYFTICLFRLESSGNIIDLLTPQQYRIILLSILGTYA